MRTKIIAGNWKMNLDVTASINLAEAISKEISTIKTDNTRVIIAPATINLYPVYKHPELDTRIEIAAQNMHQANNGAYTGEISAEMLKSVGVKTVILGHSERRTYFNETDETLAKKMTTALNNDLAVIFCFGEVLEDRKNEKHFKVVENQLQKALFHLEEKDWKKIVLAYEPVWAIGTGETASPQQAQDMHAFIRTVITKKYGEAVAQNVSILYGGSVKPSNAKEIFSQTDVDGGLIGGAALKASDFAALIGAI